MTTDDRRAAGHTRSVIPRGRAWKYDVTARNSDGSGIDLAALDAADDLWVEVTTPSRVPVVVIAHAAIAQSFSGAGNKTVTITLTAAQTTTLTDVEYVLSVSADLGDGRIQLVTTPLQMVSASEPREGASSDEVTVTLSAGVVVTVTAVGTDLATLNAQYAPLNAARRVASLSVGSFGAYPRVADSTDWEALFEHTVPAGTLNDSGAALVFHAGGTVRNNSGGTVSVNLRVPWGDGFALTALGAIDCTPSANRRKWTLTLVGTQIFEDGTTSNNGDLEWAGDFKFTTPGSGEWRPILASACYIGSGLSVRSPLVNNRFAIEAQLGTASADAEIDVRSATLFVVPAN